MDFDTSSTDAMHWAQQLVKTAKKNGFTLEQVLDEGWLVGWFANYWAAVHDPLQRRIEAATVQQWTEEPPTEPGWYWIRQPTGALKVRRLDQSAIDAEFYRSFAEGAKWSGPITPPSGA